jgi:hypothetical protein
MFNPFTDILFKKARNARDTNRKILQAIPEKRKVSSKALGEAANCKVFYFKIETDNSEQETITGTRNNVKFTSTKKSSRVIINNPVLFIGIKIKKKKWIGIWN